MHMADALVSPIVETTMWAATTGVGTYSVNKVKTVLDEKKIPLMGVMGAFVFAAQMINFSIPYTGSSGHIGGGLLLAIILGPYAGFLTMASILTIQALFFADGGLLALGCNIFNLGFYTCFIAYPLIYKPIIKRGYTTRRIFAASILATVIGLQLGAFSVVLETFFSGKADIPFNSFVILMQLIHLAIGIVEGFVVTAVVSFVFKSRPEILEASATGASLGKTSIRKVVTVLLIAAVLTGGVLSWFASSHPDGLEWSLLKSIGQETIATTNATQDKAAKLQEKTAIFSNYQVKSNNDRATDSQTSMRGGTSIAGMIGGLLTLIVVVVLGFIITTVRKKSKSAFTVELEKHEE